VKTKDVTPKTRPAWRAVRFIVLWRLAADVGGCWADFGLTAPEHHDSTAIPDFREAHKIEGRVAISVARKFSNGERELRK